MTPFADSDRNLLFGVLALQADLIDQSQFIEACTVWATQKATPLATVLLQRGWISEADRHDLEQLFERKLKKHGHDARASLLEARDAVQQSLAALNENQSTHSVLMVSDESNLSAPSATAPYIQQTRDRYRLDFIHASGGIGRVWRARDDEIGRAVALKELRPDRCSNAEYSKRFIREAQITGQLEHPSIVPVYELNRQQARPFYIMRFIHGRTLSQALRQFHSDSSARSLDFRKLLTAFVEVCNAIGYAHSRGVIHRDLKGSNVVMGDFGEVVVLDWGLAKIVGQPDAVNEPALVNAHGELDDTRIGVVVGTPSYMSPEQASGRSEQIGFASDIYGLGAILYEILTGQPPHTGDDKHEILRKAREESPLAPRLLSKGISPALEAVCLRALAHEPLKRYATAMDLAREVEHWLADEPVQAWPEPLSVRAGRWARGHRTLLAGTAALLLTAVVSLAINNILLEFEKKRTEEEKGRAETALVLANANFVEMERQRKLAEASVLAEKMAHDATDKARQRAIKNLGIAIESVEQMLTRVGEDPALLVHEPRMEQIRYRLLQDALDYYQKFLEEYADDVELRRETVRASRRSANILQELGRHDQAMPIYAQAIKLCGKLVEEFPNDYSFLQDLAGLHNSVGVLHQALGEYKQAGEAYDEALKIKRKLAQKFDDVPEYIQELANSLHNRARLFYLLGQFDQALKALEEAVRLREPLVQLYELQPSFRHYLGRDFTLMSAILANMGKAAEEEMILRHTLDLQMALSREYPMVPDYRQAIGLTRLNLGIRLRNNHNLPDAEVEMKEALKIRDALVKDFPSMPTYRSELARTHGSLALALVDQKKFDEANTTVKNGIAIQKKLVQDYPRVTEYRSQLAHILTQLGSVFVWSGDFKRAEEAFREGLDTAEKLVKEFPEVPDHRNLLAVFQLDVAAALMDKGELAAALPYLNRGLESSREAVRMQPAHQNYRALFSKMLEIKVLLMQNRKDHEGLATAAKEWQEAFPNNAEVSYALAKSMGSAAKMVGSDESLPPMKRTEISLRYCSLAVAALRSAIELGLTKIDRLKKESAFDSLRDRADFRKLLDDLYKPKKVNQANRDPSLP